MRASVVTVAATVLVKVVALCKESAIAWRFGRGDALDAFFIALVLPDFVINLVSGSFAAGFIPGFIQSHTQHDNSQALERLGAVLLASALVLLLLAAVLAWACPALVWVLASGFSPAKKALTRHLLLELLPYAVASGISSVASAALNAHERFALPSLSAALVPACTLVLLVLATPAWRIHVIPLGLDTGAILQCAALALALRRHFPGLKLRIADAPFLRATGRQILPVLASTVLMGGTVLVDQAMTSRLAPGDVAALNYGNRLITMAVGVGALAIGTAVLPYFSQLIARQDWSACRHTLRVFSKLCAASGCAATAVLALAATPLVRILYQHGHFAARDTVLVAHVQAILALQLPFYICGIMFVRFISSLQANQFLLWLTLLGLPLDVVLNALLMHWWGVLGIAAATSLMYAGLCGLEIWVAYRLLGRREAAQPPAVAQAALGGS